MATPLKDLYSPEYFEKLCQALNRTIPGFSTPDFLKHIYDEDWEERALKERMYHIRRGLESYLPDKFEAAAPYLIALTEDLRNGPLAKTALEALFIPDYIENNGLSHPDLAIDLFEKITSFSTCEFAVRPFILQDQTTVLEKMQAWTAHSDEHVRRLASEGCRPRLPWAMALPPLKKDPMPLLPILDPLKADPSEYVRRSVANNFNDIAKDNPEVVLNTFEKWNGQSKLTDWIIKHGSRTLLKQGNPRALALIGYSGNEFLKLSDFELEATQIDVGDYLPYHFQVENKSNEAAMTRIECGVYYLKANGQLSRKVFKIAEKELAGKSTERFERRQHFKPITTRVYYPGRHALSIIVNGEELVKKEFDLSL